MDIIATLTFIGAIFGAIYYPMKCAEEDSRLKRMLFGTIAFGFCGILIGILITLVIALNALLGNSVTWGAMIGSIAGVIIGIKRYDLHIGGKNKVIANLIGAAIAGAIIGTVIGIIIGLIPVSQSFWN